MIYLYFSFFFVFARYVYAHFYLLAFVNFVRYLKCLHVVDSFRPHNQRFVCACVWTHMMREITSSVRRSSIDDSDGCQMGRVDAVKRDTTKIHLKTLNKHRHHTTHVAMQITSRHSSLKYLYFAIVCVLSNATL